MIIKVDDKTNLGDFTRHTERLADVIRVVQTTVNQLNQFLIQAIGQGIQLLPNLAGQHQQSPGPHFGGNRGPQE